jgi:O-antigen/teichoic acid export membrane protein
VLSFTASNAAAGVASNGLVQLAMVFAYASGAPAKSALFAAAFALATPASLLGQSLNQVLIPHLAAGPRGSDIDVRGLGKAFLALSAALAICFGIVYALVPIVVGVIYGSEYSGAQPLMRLLVVAMWFFTIALIPAAALTAWGHTRLLAVVSACGLGVGVAAMLVLCPIIGVLGAAIGLSIGTAFMAVAITAAAWRSPLRSRRTLLVPSS